MNTTPIETGALDIVIFGGAGDLSFRKLLPALYMAHLHSRLSPETRIVAVGRQSWSREEYLDFIDKNSPQFIEKNAFTPADWQRFMARLVYVSLDVTAASDYAKLKAVCDAPMVRVFYLATAPSLFTQICANLSAAGLVDAQSRVVLEKPLGTDLASARAINTDVARYFDEQQIYRIDHYLGKETVQNLMVLRFGNAIFEPLWRAPYIKSVQITVAESVGVGSRAGFYDGAGAMRDMVQNHLLQLLCIVAMEPPISLGADDVRDEKLKVLRSLRKMDLADIKRDTVRGQYTAGASEGAAVKGYLEEDNVPAGSRTETFVALRAQINNARWANVPFFLRTGKRMQKRQSEIIIEFADQPFSIFGTTAHHEPNRLIISLQPEESIQLEMMVKEPGTGMSLHPVKLGLDLQQSSDKRRAEAYERLLMDVIKGRLTHFMRRDELEAAWMWVEPILDGWQALDDKPRNYSAGSWGPAASSALMAREDLSWFEEV
ncbi:glucose-6-phosphate dehydrogenase [Limnohabitans sp. TS-CS-82]|jgi:glucose-6-phosphate 1-dehydrogenase|uniref:glucose-6-phosphate dehydrogenase n=1 Tax=Limnohabitans sp. TS-CS-82 TaxID=2094193 RepID=UPI000CF25618|nr:glucose-6-phosphate dehydrogenase [Limnohabitans sp. TS-CS-82]PQA82906.1 glucose-6-phosphate dehydrogenase [Limnohabitans sp. TS-CS-82]